MSLIEKDYSSKPLANPKREVCLEFARRLPFKQTYQEKILDISMLLDSERGFACLLQGVVAPCGFLAQNGGREGGALIFQANPSLAKTGNKKPASRVSNILKNDEPCTGLDVHVFPLWEARLTGFLTCSINA